MCIWLDAHDQNIEMQDFFNVSFGNTGTEVEFWKARKIDEVFVMILSYHVLLFYGVQQYLNLP